MKKIYLEKMENFSAGGLTDCTTAGTFSFLAGVSAAGFLFFGSGAIFAYGAGIAYVTIYCKGRPFGN